jgi:hypothetical protein
VKSNIEEMQKAILFYATIFSLLFLFCTNNARSQSVTIKLSAEGQKAYENLLVATQFEDIVLGSAAVPSKLVEAYNVLLNEPAADLAFKQLLERGTLPGQLYALCGLWFTDNLFFRSAIEKYRNSEKWVGMLSGCLGGGTSVAALIEARKPIVIDVNRPIESLHDYFELNTKLDSEWDKRKHKKKTDKPPEGYNIDILNGGYSVWFWNKRFSK